MKLSEYSIPEQNSSFKKLKPGLNFLLILLLTGAISLLITWVQSASPALFWDELGVYGRAAFYMLDHKISILPGDLPPELSRGHPMLFVFLTSLWMKAFGENVLAGRIFMLVLGTLLTWLTFVTARENVKQGGWLILAYLLTQVPVLVQFQMILPEVMLALFTLTSLYFFLKNNIIGYFVFAGLAMLTKETGVIIPAVAIISALWIEKRIDLIKWMALLTPYSVFALFLVIQKIQNGWYFFPYHTSLISTDLLIILDNFWKAFYFLLIAQGRFVWTLFTIVALFVQIGIHKKTVKLSPVIKVSIVLIIVMVLFSSINFYMNRYFILVFPFLALIIASFSLADIYKKVWVKISIVLGFAGIFIWQFDDSSKFNYDVDFGFIRTVHTLKSAVGYLESREGIQPSDKVYCDFPTYFALKDKRYGYLEKMDSISPTRKWEDEWEYAVISNPSSYEAHIKDSSAVSQVQHYIDGFSKVTIYRRK